MTNVEGCPRFISNQVRRGSNPQKAKSQALKGSLVGPLIVKITNQGEEIIKGKR